MEEKKIVIGGCGPAGLTAAWRLVQEGYRPLLLEETGQIGGLSRTEKYHGNCLDIGGHRFFTKSPEVKELWHSLFPLQGSPAKDDIALNHPVELADGGPDPERSERVMLNRTRISRISSFPMHLPMMISRRTLWGIFAPSICARHPGTPIMPMRF